MTSVFLTQYGGAIIGPVAKLLGYLMNGIFVVLDKIGVPNIGLSIILFTLIIYLILTPLTIKQQKFSKLSAKINPEVQAIQAKYKNKKDQESMNKMNEETRAVYAKYGVSPSGSCVQLIIQMPILFALYRVIYAMPAYVVKVGDTFRVLAEKIVSQDNGSFLLNATNDQMKSVAVAVNQYSKNVNADLTNGVIDILNKVSSSDMVTLSDKYGLSDLTYNGSVILSKFDNAGNIISRGLIDTYNNFLGLNIANSPSYMVSNAFQTKHFGLLLAGLLIPFLAAFTQWVNTKLMPQPDNNANQDNAVAQSMKTMNVTMPLMSAVFCFTLPSGMGLYWIAGAVVRSVQQIVINKHIDKMDIDSIIEKNLEKEAKKIEKKGVSSQTLASNSKISTKTITDNKSYKSQNEKDEIVKKATSVYANGKLKEGSLASKANMVKSYNEKNNK